MDDTRTEKEWLSVKEVAARLDVDRQTVYRWIAAGKLPAIKIAGTVRVPKASLERNAQ